MTKHPKRVARCMEWSPAERSPGRNYHFMVSAVAPRPIAWVTTLHGDTVNLAPFSWFQSVCADPPMVMLAFADRHGELKDTCRNILEGKEFVINAVTEELAAQMVATSGDLPPTASEAEAAGVALAPSVAVGPPRVPASPFHLECRYVEHHRYGDKEPTTVIIAEVVHIHADDAVLDERGNIDNAKVPLLARLGGSHYVVTKELVQHRRPA